MEKLELLIGNQRYSSWSMRPWLALAVPGIPFQETVVPFHAPDFRARVGSPSDKVPLLVHGDLRIHESLAICEYIAELHPEARLWPVDGKKRALARALSAEMHAGFAALRNECSMDVVVNHDVDLSSAARADVARIDAIWSGALAQSGGPFLFGDFTIVDAMYAPVTTRITTYGLDVGEASRGYVRTLAELPAMKRWVEAGKSEKAKGWPER